MKMVSVLGLVAVGSLFSMPAFAGFGLPGGLSCNNDHGVEQAGKDMDEKAYNGLIAAETALASMQDAAGKPDDAKKSRANLELWKNKDKAPSGIARVKEVGKASDAINTHAEAVGKTKADDKGKAAIVEARSQLRMAVIQIAWGVKIAAPVPANAKAAIADSKACTTKVKGPVDAAAGITTLLTNIKKTYTSVSDAAKKAGAPDLTDADKKAQDSSSGAPGDLGAGV